DDLYLGDPIAVNAVVCLQLDAVTRLDVFQRPEEAVPVTGDADVAAPVGSSHALDESGAAIQVQFARTHVDRHFDVDGRNPQHCHRFAHIDADARVVLADADIGPHRTIFRRRSAGEARERRLHYP